MMSDGADQASTRTCENSLAKEVKDGDKSDVPPVEDTAPTTTNTYSGRRPRFGTSNVPTSPYVWVDGRKLRSALAYTKKWPPRRVSFPTNDSHLVTGYLEPSNPWRYAENVNREDLISAYQESCVRHNTDPLESILNQLKNLDISEDRCDELNLKGEVVNQNRAETLEEIFKRIQFNKISLEATSLDDESSVILFDMLEYYESAKNLNISCNPDIGVRGWQACSHMIKKTQCLEQLEAKDVMLNEQYMNILSRALRLVCHLHVLKLENCGLSGRSIIILVTALKMNTGIRELYLADNGLNLYDAIQLGSLLRFNCHIQLLDISNNNVQDDGVGDILEGLINQINEDKDGKGLNILILWNNRLTKQSSSHFARIIAHSKTLETLNVGQNSLTDEMLLAVKDALKKNRVLLQLGMQSTEITCDGVVALSEVMNCNQVLQRIDLRDNSIRMTGMQALTIAMKANQCITQLDLDDKPRERIDGTLREYMDLVTEIRSYCMRNEENRTMEESPEDEESPPHQSRFCSASSRKISLTCQTLPCSPRSMTPIQNDELGKSMTEPKRTGGRLRSPAPSPIPSPVASPIPSPSRNRFVVSKVPEASLRSSDSSASSSPVTPPSFGSLSTCFFSGATGSSRFRVSVVESASPVPSPKPIVAVSTAAATIGFNFTVDTVESTDSDDSDSVFKSELEPSHVNVVTRQLSVPSSDKINSTTDTDEIGMSLAAHTSVDTKDDSTKECNVSKKHIKVQPQDSMNIIKLRRERLRDNQNEFPVLSEETSIENVEKEESSLESTNDSCLSVNLSESRVGVDTVTDAPVSLSTETTVPVTVATEQLDTSVEQATDCETRAKQNSSVQKHSSNLEKLLSLFQHPGSLFSESSSVSQSETKNPLQDSVNSMIALGDKFQQYLRDSRTCKANVTTETTTQPLNISPLSTKSKSMKPQLSSIQSLTSMFASLKFDSNVNHLGTCTKSCKNSNRNQCYTLEEERKKEKDSADISSSGCIETSAQEDMRLNVSKEKEENVSSSNNQPLPEIVQSKDNVGHSNKHLVLDVNRVSTNTMVEARPPQTSPTIAPATVADNKMTVCVPKLTDIPEYSTLDISDSNAENQNIEYELTKTLDAVNVEKQCDRTTTDSINPTSDSNSSSCNVTCDIRIDRVNDKNTMDAFNNTCKTNFENDGDEDVDDDKETFNSSVHRESAETVPFTCTNDVNCNLNNDNINCCTIESNLREEKCLKDNVTDNRDDETLTDSHDISRRSIENIDTCHADDNRMRQRSTTVNSTMNVPKSELSFISKKKIGSCRCASAHVLPSKNYEKSRTEVLRTEEESERLEDRQLSAPNSVNVYQTIFKDVYVDSSVEDLSKNSVHNEGTIPMVILSEEKETEEDRTVAVEKDTEDLIFCITDISPVGVEEETLLSSSTDADDGWTPDVRKLSNSLFDLSRAASHSPTNLVAKSPDAPHRNSQDSGIEESNSSTLEENVPEIAAAVAVAVAVAVAAPPRPKENLQESVDSGIDSECSSVCVKADSGVDVANEASVLQKTLEEVGIRDSCGNIGDLADFESDVVGDLRHVQLNDIDTIDHSYLEMIKCAVVTPEYSVNKISITDTMSNGGVTPEEGGIAVPESSAIVRATSPK